MEIVRWLVVVRCDCLGQSGQRSLEMNGPPWSLPREFGLRGWWHGEEFNFVLGAGRETDSHGENFELVHLGVEDRWFLACAKMSALWAGVED